MYRHHSVVESRITLIHANILLVFVKLNHLVINSSLVNLNLFLRFSDEFSNYRPWNLAAWSERGFLTTFITIFDLRWSIDHHSNMTALWDMAVHVRHLTVI